LLVTTTAIDHDTPGWLLLAGLFLAAGTGTLLIARGYRATCSGDADGRQAVPGPARARRRA
jgi:hypothetical protein